MRRIAARARIAGVALFGLLAACGGDDEKSISIALDDALVSVAQGSRDSVIVTVTRKNQNLPVELSVDGTLPAGVTTSFSQNPLPPGVTTTRLRFIATGSAVPATATVTLRATSEGVAEKAEDIEITVTLTGSYTLSALQPSIIVAQGGAGDGIVLLTRSAGNASSVTLDVTGAPAGVLATTTSPITTRGTTLSVAAAANVAPGTYPLTITGSAAGTTNQTTQVSLVVIPPPATASLTVPFCSTFMPAWFAFQNEGFGWQRVQPTGASFVFDATQKVAIAFVFSVGPAAELDVFYSTRSGLAAQSDRDCDGLKTLQGSVSGLSTGQGALVVMGSSAASTTTSGPYTLQAVAARPLDLVATRGATASGFLTPDKMIVRRAQDLSTTIPDLDFNSVEAFAPVTSNLTVAGISAGFSVEFRNSLWSATSTHGTVHSGAATAGSASLSSMPPGQLVAGDLHELLVEGFQSNGLIGHAVISYFTGTGDRTETLGPLLPSPSFSVVATAPHSRTRAQMSSQPEYAAATQFILTQVVGGSPRYLNLVGTAPYFGSLPATWDLIVPDLSAVTGFTADWMLVAGQATSSTTIAYAGRDELLFGALPIAGESYKLAYRNSSVPTLLPLRSASPGITARSPLMRRTPIMTQYFRR